MTVSRTLNLDNISEIKTSESFECAYLTYITCVPSVINNEQIFQQIVKLKTENFGVVNSF